MALTPDQRTRAKEYANQVADQLAPGAVASEFRTAGRDPSWRQYEPAERLLEAIHLIVERAQAAEQERVKYFENMVGR